MAVEKELKILIPSQSDYLKILNFFGKEKNEYNQINYYIDTSDFHLLRMKVMYRIRYDGHTFLATVKSKTKSENGVQCSQEEECTLKTFDFSKQLLQDTFGRLKPFADNFLNFDFICIGQLENRRKVFEFNKQLIEIDETKIGKNFFYEIEVEAEDPSWFDEYFRDLYIKLGIEFEYSKSKFSRFLEYIQVNKFL